MAKRVLCILGLLLVAFCVRWLAAREAYPIPGDGGHFVQWGVAMAHGHAKLNTYWSQGMVASAALAERLGVDPKRTLQGVSFVAGMLVVLLFAGIAEQLTKNGWWGMAAGLWAATNLTLVKYSIEGYSEMAYMAFLTGAVYVAVGGKTGWKRDIVVGVLLGLGGWFKGLDAAVAACAYGLWRWIWGGRTRWDWHLAAVAPLVAFIVLMPLCLYTFAETGQFAPGSKGNGNFLLGPDWKDSKVVYAAEGLKVRTWRKTVRALPRQMVGNVHDMFRIANEQFFERGLRMGTIWFGLLAIGVVWKWGGKEGHRGGNARMLPACLAVAQLGAMSLAFVHDRIMVPTLPWLALLGLLGICEWMKGRECVPRCVWACVFAVYTGVFAVYSTHAFRTEFAWWRYTRVKSVAEGILSMGMTEGDVVMHYGPQMSIETHHENPLLTVEVPYGSIEEVGQVAREQGVRFAAISDTWRGHWPIAELFNPDVEPPEGWVMKKEWSFPSDAALGTSAERIRVYEIAHD